MKHTTGHRIHPENVSIFKNGDYGKINGEWIVKTPNGLMASIRNHKVTEHEDGTISASPSILISGTNYPDTTETLTWHGYLEQGVWREV